MTQNLTICQAQAGHIVHAHFHSWAQHSTSEANPAQPRYLRCCHVIGLPGVNGPQGPSWKMRFRTACRWCKGEGGREASRSSFQWRTSGEIQDNAEGSQPPQSILEGCHLSYSYLESRCPQGERGNWMTYGPRQELRLSLVLVLASHLLSQGAHN